MSTSYWAGQDSISQFYPLKNVAQKIIPTPYSAFLPVCLKMWLLLPHADETHTPPPYFPFSILILTPVRTPEVKINLLTA